MFIYPDVGGIYPNYSPAIETLSACLKEAGNDVSLIHVNEKFCPLDFDEIYGRVKEYSPDIIGITCTTNVFSVGNEIAGEIKKRGYSKMIIMGGIHATIAPDDLEESNFDAFSVGEGERTLPELCRRMGNGEDIYSVKGMIFKKDGEIINTGAPEVILSLDEIPPRDFEIMNISELLKLKNGYFDTAFSRGCPFMCSFCINHTLKNQYKQSCDGKYYRCQSVDRAIGDLHIVIDKYHDLIKVVDLEHDLLLMDKNWFRDFAERFKNDFFEKYGIKYVISSRADMIDEDTVILLKKSGCEFIGIGVEAGSEDVRNGILRKNIYDKSLKNAFDLLNKYELRSLAFFMIGVPGESHETIKKDLELIRRLKPSMIRMSIFQPFEGTELYKHCEDNDLFTDASVTSSYFTSSSLIKFENLTSQEMKSYHLLFPWYLNLDFVEKYESEYKTLIEKYSSLSEEELMKEETRQLVLSEDRKLSNKLKSEGIMHFAYFEKNSRNYCLIK